MKTSRYAWLPLLLLLTATAAVAQTQPGKQQAKAEAKAAKQLKKDQKKLDRLKKKEEQNKATEKDVVYLFGVGLNFNDSVVYMTDIQQLNYMKLERKTKFLPYRSDLSQQLKDHLEAVCGKPDETTSIFYDVKRKKAAKRFYKLKKRFLDEGTSNLTIFDSSQFRFKKPEWE